MTIEQKYISLNTYAYGCPCIHNGYLIVDSLTAMTAYRWDGTSIQYIASVNENSINYVFSNSVKSKRLIFSNGTYIFRGCSQSSTSGSIKVYTFDGNSFTHIATSVPEPSGYFKSPYVFGVDFTTNPITVFSIGFYYNWSNNNYYYLQSFDGSTFSSLGVYYLTGPPVYRYQWDDGCLSAKNGIYHGIVASSDLSTTPNLKKVSLTYPTGTTPDYQATSPCMDIISKNDKTFFSGTPVDTLLAPGIYGDYSITDYKNCTLDYDGSYIYAAGSKNNGQLVVAVLKPGNPMTVVGEMALPSEITAQSPLWGKGRIWVAGNNRVVYVLGLGSTPGTPLNSPQVLSVYEASDITADFSSDQTSGSAPLTVNFFDESTGSPTSWYWDFGDGNTSTDQNPTHVYGQGGIYTVTLSLNGGESSKTKTDYITVNIVADFEADVRSGDPSLSVQFSDLSYGDPTLWFWDFGDGITSSEKNPNHIYQQPGVYTVSLKIQRLLLEETVIKEEYIKINFIDSITKLSYIYLLPIVGTKDIAPPIDRYDISIMYAKGPGNYVFTKNGVRVMINKNVRVVENSGFSRSNGPSLTFD